MTGKGTEYEKVSFRRLFSPSLAKVRSFQSFLLLRHVHLLRSVFSFSSSAAGIRRKAREESGKIQPAQAATSNCLAAEFKVR